MWTVLDMKHFIEFVFTPLFCGTDMDQTLGLVGLQASKHTQSPCLDSSTESGYTAVRTKMCAVLLSRNKVETVGNRVTVSG